MLDTKHSISNLFPASLSDMKSGRRLLVLIPPLDINIQAFAQRVWELANTTGSSIQFLSLVTEANGESKARRELANISAMFKNTQVQVQTKIESGKDWVDIVRTYLQIGDVLVCLVEHRVGSTNKHLSQILQSKFDTEIYILSGFVAYQESKSHLISQILAWVGSIAIILGFFYLQVRITDLTKDGMHTLLMLITVPIGMWALWAWNSLFG